LVPRDDLVFGDFAVNGTDLLITNTVMALGVNLVKVDVAAAWIEGIECFHRKSDQSEGQRSAPARMGSDRPRRLGVRFFGHDSFSFREVIRSIVAAFSSARQAIDVRTPWCPRDRAAG